MRPLSLLSFAVAALWLAAASSAPALETGKTITMVADNWCPFNCDPADTDPGFLVEVAQKAFEPEGYKVTYQIVPWARAIEEVMAGKYTILLAASVEETPDVLFPKSPRVSCGFDVFVKEGNPFVWKGVDSIRDKRIGGVQDYMYSEAVNAYIEANKNAPGHKVQIQHGDESLPTNIKKLLGGRIDVLFENSAVLTHKFHTMGDELADLGLSGKPHYVGSADDKPTDCYLGFSPARPDSHQLMELLAKRGAEMEADGTMAKLRDKYGIQ